MAYPRNNNYYSAPSYNRSKKRTYKTDKPNSGCTAFKDKDGKLESVYGWFRRKGEVVSIKCYPKQKGKGAGKVYENERGSKSEIWVAVVSVPLQPEQLFSALLKVETGNIVIPSQNICLSPDNKATFYMKTN